MIHILQVSNSSFKQNHASQAAGAILAQGELSTFMGNGTADEGRIVEDSWHNILSCLIHSSMFVGHTARYGGAIVAIGVHILLEKSYFVNNSVKDTIDTDGIGGAVFLYSEFGARFQISSSSFVQNSASQTGGAIETTSQTIIQDSKFLENSAGWGGGAIAIVNFNITSHVKPKLTVFTCRFLGNTANYGGAIYSKHVSLILMNCHFMKNSALQHTNVAGMGGAVYISLLNRDHSAQISNSTFNQNQASGGGGGGVLVTSSSSGPTIDWSTLLQKMTVRADGRFIVPSVNITTSHHKSRKHVNITNCTFLHNTAELGGALVTISVPIFIQNNHFENNSVPAHTMKGIPGNHISSSLLDSGGAVVVIGAQANVKDSQFIRNIAKSQAGALWFSSSTPLTITRCLFQFNVAVTGGALFSSEYPFSTETQLFLLVQNSTFTHNSAVYGGGISCSGSFLFTFCNFKNNTAG